MQNTQDLSNIYLWLDTEFTTLELEKARLLQMAVIATDSRLERILPSDQDLNFFIGIDDDIALSPWVADNLKDLVAVCRSDRALPIADVGGVVGRWLLDNFGSKRAEISARPIIAGNSIFCDYCLMRKFVPELVEFAHYRMLDVSSWKVHLNNSAVMAPFDKDSIEVIKANLPWTLSGDGGEHDAYFDVQASIAELNYYMKALTEVRR